jgi:hypothetical protein
MIIINALNVAKIAKEEQKANLGTIVIFAKENWKKE